MVHEELLLQAESSRPLVALQPTVAPPTGVTPSACSTCTLTGLIACAPTGVDGLMAVSRKMLSLSAAPKVRAFVITLEEPLTGSAMVMLCAPSPKAGAATIIWPVLMAS